MDKTYRLITYLIAPLLPLWLALRQRRGKEDGARLRERYGFATRLRPAGALVWLHAASVGEANSVLLLIQKIRERFPSLNLLLTTGTVTSARLMATRLPQGIIHQYAPIDTPQAARRFITHWKPSMAFFVESEFWPNLIRETNALQCFMGVINARMSKRSFAGWKKHPAMIAGMLGCFDIIFAQSEADGKRLLELGARNVQYVGNLKYDAALLPCDEGELLRLRNVLGARPVWLAASTHPGEEKMIADAHRLVASILPDLLTVIVPRHPERGTEIARITGKYGLTSRRSEKDPIMPQTAFYVADTIGELGLFYRLAPVSFMGGSLVAHGGQNPLEPARLSSAIVTGPYTHNFAAMYMEMEKTGACRRVADTAFLADAVTTLLSDSDALVQMQRTAKQWLDGKTGAAERMLQMLFPVLQLSAR